EVHDLPGVYTGGDIDVGVRAHRVVVGEHRGQRQGLAGQPEPSDVLPVHIPACADRVAGEIEVCGQVRFQDGVPEALRIVRVQLDELDLPEGDVLNVLLRAG